MKRLTVILFLFCAGQLAASPAPAPEAEASVDAAAVTLDGEALFQVRGMAGYSAEERAKAIAARIEKVAVNQQISTGAISVVALADRTNILAGETLLVSLLDSDAALEKLPRHLLATSAQANVTRAIVDHRYNRSTIVLLRRTILAVLATVGLFLLLLGVGLLFRRVILFAERQIKTRVELLEERSSKAVESRPLWAAVLGVINAVRFVVAAVIVYAYLNLVLGLYPWTRPVAARLFSLFIDPLKTLGLRFVGFLPDLFFLIVLSIVVRYLLKVTRLFFASIDKGTLAFKDFERDWAWPTYRIVRILIICFALVVAYPYIPGSDSDAFKGVSLFAGVLFSLGSTSFIANMIAGIALTYRRAFRVGDVIRVEDAIGIVTDMRLQATHVRTLKNEAVVIPNSQLVNNHVVNYTTLSKEPGLVLHTTVNVGYDKPWRQVEAMLLQAADRTAGLQKDRPPFVLQKSLGDFSIVYELNVFCETPMIMPRIYANLHRNILDVFNEHNVQIMTPAYEGDPEIAKVVPKEKWHTAPAAGAAPADKSNA